MAEEKSRLHRRLKVSSESHGRDPFEWCFTRPVPANNSWILTGQDSTACGVDLTGQGLSIFKPY